MTGKKIVLITTGQPSTNPRIVKEADILQAHGFMVTVLYCFFADWATASDKTLLKDVKWNYVEVGGSPFRNKAIYFYTKVRYKAARILNRYIGNKFLIAERAHARCYDELLRLSIANKADWYIGHNLGALSVCARAAKSHAAKSGFDFEDYYSGENDSGKKISGIEFLEEKYLPSVNYISASSMMIARSVINDFPGLASKVIVLRNCFPVSQQPAFNKGSQAPGTLQLFWFSQTIGDNRGLQMLVEAIRISNNKQIHLTLAGRLDRKMSAYFKKLPESILERIHFAGIVPPADLPQFSSHFDIGLALETGFSKNNRIALSNKIFTYILAGNAVILSETPMQEAFNKEYKCGEMVSINNAADLINKIESYMDPEKLSAQREYNYKLAQRELNWEKESENLLNIL